MQGWGNLQGFCSLKTLKISIPLCLQEVPEREYTEIVYIFMYNYNYLTTL